MRICYGIKIQRKRVGLCRLHIRVYDNGQDPTVRFYEHGNEMREGEISCVAENYLSSTTLLYGGSSLFPFSWFTTHWIIFESLDHRPIDKT
jgi:hypothetical protein